MFERALTGIDLKEASNNHHPLDEIETNLSDWNHQPLSSRKTGSLKWLASTNGAVQKRVIFGLILKEPQFTHTRND